MVQEIFEKKQSVFGKRPQKNTCLCLGMLFLFLIYISLLLCPYNSYVFHFDPQVYILGGRTMAEGGALYTDFFDHKGPVFYFLNYLGYTLQHGFWGIWALHFIFVAFVIANMFFALRKYMREYEAALSCAGLLGMHSLVDSPDMFSMDCILLSLAFILRDPKSAWAFCMSGIFAAFAFLSKFTHCSFFAALFVYLLLEGWRLKSQKKTLFYILGGVSVIVVVCSIMGIRGNLKDFFDSYFVFNLMFSEKGSMPLVTALVFAAKKTLPRIVPAVICLAYARYRGAKNTLIFGCWLFWCFLEYIQIIMAGENNLGNYFLGLFFALFLTSITLFMDYPDHKRNVKAVLIFYLLMAVLFSNFLLFKMPMIFHRRGMFVPTRTDRAMMERISMFPDKKLWILSPDLYFYLWADKRSHSRYYFDYALALQLQKNFYNESEMKEVFKRQLPDRDRPLILVQEKYKACLDGDFEENSADKKIIYWRMRKDWLLRYYKAPETFGSFFLYVPKE